MDRHFDDQGFNDSGLKSRPSDIFRRQCWISFEPVEGSLAHLADYIGANKILWATDYPHRDGFFPGAPDMIEKQLDAAGVSAATKHGVMAGGAMSFYGLN
jgi:predicted TIM-barrel fold metal-dependent hydrolase